jgi:hypothetical protein
MRFLNWLHDMARIDKMTASSMSREEANKEILEESEHVLVPFCAIFK